MLSDAGLFFEGTLGGPAPFAEAAAEPSAIFPDVASGAPTYAGPADRWGLVHVPLAPPREGDAVGDPALTVLLEFLQAFLVADGNTAKLWNATGIARGLPCVKTARPWNPSDAHGDHRGVGFNTADLPALYLWRDAAKEEWIAEDWWIDKTQLKLLWVFPLAVQHSQRVRMPFANALVKCVGVAIERGRTPAWRVEGDPDANAASHGSSLYTFLNACAINLVAWKPARVTVENDAQRDSFAAAEMTIELEENLEYDLTAYDEDLSLSQQGKNEAGEQTFDAVFEDS